MSEFSTEELVGILKRLYECFPVEQFKTTDEIIRHDIAYQKIRRRLEASHPDYTKQYIPMPKKVSREWVEKWVAVFVPLDIPAECMHSTIEQNRLRVEKLLKELGHEVGE